MLGGGVDWYLVSCHRNSIVHRYVRGDGIDEVLVDYAGSGTTGRSWLHADERGSIVAIANDSGVMTSINRYDEYGIPGGTNQGRFQYTGQAWLPELGMYYYKARMYSPTLGRFMQTDPIGPAGGINLYAYVGNDPINATDPLGLVIDDQGPTVVITANYRYENAPVETGGGRSDGGSSSTESNTGPTIVVTGTRRNRGNSARGLGTPQKTKQERQSCVVNKLAKVGDQMQNYGLLFGLGGAVATAVAPEALVGESTVASGIALYGADSALKDSVSITNFVFNRGNANGFALGRLNNFLLNNFPEGPSRNVAEHILDQAEHKAGLDRGDEGGC